MSPSSSSFVQTNRDFAATNEEEDNDDDASNNWMRLINNRRDREKIARLRDADDPSLRAMFDAITTTLKQKDENGNKTVQGAAMMKKSFFWPKYTLC